MRSAKKRIVILVLGYMSAGLFFLMTILLARIYPVSQYALVAFSVAFGSVGLVVVNFGSDVALTKALILEKEIGLRSALLANNLRLRALMVVLVCVLAVLVVTYLNYSITDSCSTVLLVLWVVCQGVFPNSHYESTSSIDEQQKLIFAERVLTLIYLLVVAFFLGGLLWIAIGFSAIRAVFCIFQYSEWIKKNKGASFSFFGSVEYDRAGVSSKVTMSLLFNATVGCFNQISLEFYGYKSELAAYGLCFQLFSIVAIFQGTAIRLISRELNESAIAGDVLRGDVIKRGGFVVFVSIVLALVGVFFLKYVLVRLGGVWELISNELLAALGVWVAISGWGQVVTRYLLALGKDSAYLLISGLGALVTISVGLIVVPKWGASGVAFTLLLVHSFMIIVYTGLLFEKVKR